MTVVRRELLVGVDRAPPVPFCFGLPDSNDFRGFEVDLLDDLARRLGVTFRFTSALWSQILDDLEAGRIDMICTAATITAARRRLVDFSDPYLESDLALVFRQDRSVEIPVVPPEWTVGVRVATVAEDVARTRWPGRRIQTFDLNVDLYDALRLGGVDVAVDDRPIAAFFARTTGGLSLGPSIPGTGGHYGIAFSRGNDALRLAVNRHLADMREDGSLGCLQRRWLVDTPLLESRPDDAK